MNTLKTPPILIGLLVLILSPLPSSTLRFQEPSKSKSQEKLRLRILATNPEVCTNGTLKLEIELQNVSHDPVLVDPRGVLYRISLSGDQKSETTVSDPGPGGRRLPDYVTLKPGDSFRRETTLPAANSIFVSEGIYKVRVTYGQFKDDGPSGLYRGVVESNYVLFRTNECP